MLPICASASLPLVGFPIKQSPATGPYDDAKFLEQTNTSIYGLSNQTIPTGITLRNLQTMQQQLSKMSISPELYPKAVQINAFLYYTVKAGDEYDDANILSDKPYTPITSDSAIFREAEEYYQAATSVWKTIKDQYPGVTLYTMPGSGSSSNDNSDSGLFNYETQTQQRGHSGLW